MEAKYDACDSAAVMVTTHCVLCGTHTWMEKYKVTLFDSEKEGFLGTGKNFLLQHTDNFTVFTSLLVQHSVDRLLIHIFL